MFTAKLGSTLVNSFDTIVISAFLGLTILAMYENYYFIMTAVIGVVSVIFNSCTAGIGNSLVTESLEKNYQDFRKLSFVIFWITSVCVACFISMYQPFMELWVGKDYMFGMSVVVLFCCYFYLFIINNIAVAYKEAGGIWHEDRFRPLIGALVNLILNLLMVRALGVYAVLLSTILSYIFVAMPWLIHNVFSIIFKRSPIEYLKELLRNVCITILIGGAVYFASILVPFEGIIKIILNCIISITISNILLFIFYRKSDMFNPFIDLLDKISCYKANGILRKLRNSSMK